MKSIKTIAAALYGILLLTSPPAVDAQWSVECTDNRACHLKHIGEDETTSRFTCRNDMAPPLIARHIRNGIKIVNKEPMTALRQLASGVDPVQLQLSQFATMEVSHDLREQQSIDRTRHYTETVGYKLSCQVRTQPAGDGYREGTCFAPSERQGWLHFTVEKSCSWVDEVYSDSTELEVQGHFSMHTDIDPPGATCGGRYCSPWSDCVWKPKECTGGGTTRSYNVKCEELTEQRTETTTHIEPENPFSINLENWRYECSVIGVEVPNHD